MECIGTAKARVDHLLLGLDRVDEPVLVLREFEEVVTLSHFSHFAEDLWPLAIYFFFFGNELLLAYTVVAIVISFVDLALVIELLKNLPNYSLMAILRGTDVVVVGNIKRAAEALKFCSEAITDFNWRHTCLLG